MKILLFAHSSSPGGAENALRHLVNLLRLRHHEVHLVLPSIDSHEGRYYQSLGLRCFEFPIPMALPNLTQALLTLLQINWLDVTKTLQQEGYGLMISNTMATLHGNLIAHMLRIPHITYIHEFLEDAELLPTSLGRLRYLHLISEGSVGLLGCSRMALSQFDTLSGTIQPRMVLTPFDFTQSPVTRPLTVSPRRVLQVIGTLSHRKNGVFASAVVKALNVLGQPVELIFVGTSNNAEVKLKQVLRKRGISATVLPHQSDPYEKNLGMNAITLVCARSEPFGLTLAESLCLGVPAVAARCGGPEEILPPDRLFDIDDVDGCVRILLSIWNDYEEACAQTRSTYDRLHKEAIQIQPEDTLTKFVEDLSLRTSADRSSIADLLQMLKHLVEAPVGLNLLTQSILSVATENGLNLKVENLMELIELERLQPGRAVTADIVKFGAIPFGMSAEMGQLYQQGLGLAIELAATSSDPGRVEMAAFIACSLWQVAQDSTDPLTVLALGDGVGTDSIRLALAGFTVHYMDYEQSNMAKIAAHNFEACAAAIAGSNVNQPPRIVQKVEQKYDAVVCLEVIEHVSDLENFISFIADSLKPNGFVYISDCFNGVEDRWPTHLICNEGYAGQLPFLMHSRFKLVDCNRLPYAKPYVFRKRMTQEYPSILELLHHRDVMTHLVMQQLDLGGCAFG